MVCNATCQKQPLIALGSSKTYFNFTEITQTTGLHFDVYNLHYKIVYCLTKENAYISYCKHILKYLYIWLEYA